MKYKFEADYKKMYLTLMDSIETVKPHLYNIENVIYMDMLVDAQLKCEEIYLNSTEYEDKCCICSFFKKLFGKK